MQWAKQSPPPVVIRPDPGDSPHPAPPVPPLEPTETVNTPKVVSTVAIPAPTSKAPQTAAPLPLCPSAAIASQAATAVEAVEVVDAALDHSSHRDRAGGRRIAVSQKTVDELAGTPGRPSRSNGGQHHAVVTPRIEISPDRSDFAKLGETIAASLVQEQEHANHASVLLEHTKQLADDIRSQVDASSSDPAFHTYASGLMAHEATPNDNRLKVRRPYPPVVPKFANPDEPSQVWAGRAESSRDGLQKSSHPDWLLRT